MVIFVIILISVFVLVLLFLPPSRIIYLRKVSSMIILASFTLSLLFMTETTIKAASSGLKLWAASVVPSLFPFFTAAEVMYLSGMSGFLGGLLECVMRPLFNVPGSGSFALIIGLLSGSPVGAKITCDLRKSNMLTRTEAERLISFTSNTSPLFIIGVVGSGMYSSTRLGIYFFVCHLLSCLSTGFVFRFYKAGHGKGKNRRRCVPCESIGNYIATSAGRRSLGNISANQIAEKQRSGSILGEAIKNSVLSVLTIGGFIVFFSVILGILSESGFISALTGLFTLVLAPFNINARLLEAVIYGFLEMTSGSAMISTVKSIPPSLKLAASAFVMGWTGISIHLQVISMASGTDISMRPYFLGKMIQGILFAIYAGLGIVWFPLVISILAGPFL